MFAVTLLGVFDSSIPMTTASELGALPELVREMSGAKALSRLLKENGFPTTVLDTPDAKIPLQATIQLFDAAAREVGEYGFGLRVGQGTGLEDFGDWAVYSLGARNLEEGLHRVCDTIWLHDTGGRMWLAPELDHVVWRYTTELSLNGVGRAYSDHLVKPMLDFLRAFLGEDWKPEWLELDYQRPLNQQGYEDLVEGSVIFEQPFLGIPVPRTELAKSSQVAHLLPHPITSADLRRYVTRQNPDPMEQVINLINLSFSDGKPTLDRTAQLLSVGPRTLQRSLSRNGTQFGKMLKVARKRRAIALLLETERSVKVIASDLGYCEAQNFTRAFKSWFGSSPTKFRAERGTRFSCGRSRSEPAVS